MHIAEHEEGLSRGWRGIPCHASVTSVTQLSSRHQHAGRSYRNQVVKDEVEANSPQQVTGYGVELAFLSHHGLQQGGLPSVTSRGLLAGKG